MLQSLFNKVAGPQACNFIKKRLQHRCFSMKFAKILRTPPMAASGPLKVMQAFFSSLMKTSTKNRVFFNSFKIGLIIKS